MFIVLFNIVQVKQSLDISLNIYGKSWSAKARILCMCYTGYNEENFFLSCSMCKDRWVYILLCHIVAAILLFYINVQKYHPSESSLKFQLQL
jgi:hypothetical protein